MPSDPRFPETDCIADSRTTAAAVGNPADGFGMFVQEAPETRQEFASRNRTVGRTLRLNPVFPHITSHSAASA
jgi:hypothetical protein